MISMRTLSMAAAGLVFTASGYSAEPIDHSAHHAEADAAGGAMNMDDGDATMTNMNQQMDDHLKLMHEMHVKMTAAQTPAERNALLAQHLKVMQDGMDMMNAMMAKDDMAAMQDMHGMKDMHGMGKSRDGKAPMATDMAMHHSMMKQHMQMMHSMMQMMIDALPQPVART